MNTLTDFQQRFCEEYIIDLNSTKAAIRCGIDQSEAKYIGQKNFEIPQVKAYINKLLEKRRRRLQLAADDVLRRVHDLAHSDVFLVLDAVKQGKEKDLPTEIRQTVKSIRCKESVRPDRNGKEEIVNEYHIVMHDVQAPLNLLWKHVGLGQSDAEAIATLTTYGEVKKLKNGLTFTYHNFDDDSE